MLALLASVLLGVLSGPVLSQADPGTDDVVCDSPTPPELSTETLPTEAAVAGGERIEAYDLEVTIEPDGSAVIVETIDYDFGSQARHGILRDLITVQRCNDDYDRVYPLTIGSVSSPTAPDRYVIESWEHGDRVRVGDPDRTVTGLHTYELTYRLEGVLNAFPDHLELYWNAVGTSWDVPIENVRVLVHTQESPEQVACFAGPAGSRASCTSASTGDGVATFEQASLGPHQGLTVAVALPEGAADPARFLEQRWSLARAFTLTPVTIAGAALLLVGVVAVWAVVAYRVGRDHQLAGSHVDAAFAPVGARGAPVGLFDSTETPVEFVPPDRIRPGQVGVLVDEVAHPVDVTATIVDLAVRGHLRIEEEGSVHPVDYRIVRRQADTGDLLAYERRLLDHLVATPGSSVLLSELRHEFAAEFQEVVGALYDDTVRHGWFRRRPDRVRRLWLGVGIVAEVLTVGALVALAAFTELALLGVPLVVGATLLLVGSRWMPRRTPAGTGMLRRVKGFQVFIQDSEAPRARWAEHRNIFSEYLPYAIVFRCADRWARTFEDLGAEGLGSVGDWYVGRSSFSALYLTGAMTSFTSTAGTTLSTPAPSTSGGSGFSGFSGGGFSGGGFGGGGGGSW